MLNRLPKDTPSFAELVADMGHPKPAAVGRALGVSERTARRWMSGKAPRTALLSLWWLSRQGYSAWDAEMHNRGLFCLDGTRNGWSFARIKHAANDKARRRVLP